MEYYGKIRGPPHPLKLKIIIIPFSILCNITYNKFMGNQVSLKFLFISANNSKASA